MATKNDEKFIAFCNDLRAYVEEHHLFPDKHTQLSHKVKYTRKKINEGTLEEWKRVMFEEVAGMRDLSYQNLLIILLYILEGGIRRLASSLITSRRVIFTPNADIKQELKATGINIICYDRNGQIVKRVTSTDDGDIEDPDDDNGGDNGGGTPSGGNTQGSGTNTNRQYSLNISSADTSKGTVDTSVNKSYSECSRVNIKATLANGYVFDKWSDGNTSATRTVTMNANTTLVASFKELSQGGGDSTGENDDPAFL